MVFEVAEGGVVDGPTGLIIITLNPSGLLHQRFATMQGIEREHTAVSGRNDAVKPANAQAEKDCNYYRASLWTQPIDLHPRVNTIPALPIQIVGMTHSLSAKASCSSELLTLRRPLRLTGVDVQCRCPNDH